CGRDVYAAIPRVEEHRAHGAPAPTNHCRAGQRPASARLRYSCALVLSRPASVFGLPERFHSDHIAFQGVPKSPGCRHQPATSSQAFVMTTNQLQLSLLLVGACLGTGCATSTDDNTEDPVIDGKADSLNSPSDHGMIRFNTWMTGEIIIAPPN